MQFPILAVWELHSKMHFAIILSPNHPIEPPYENQSFWILIVHSNFSWRKKVKITRDLLLNFHLFMFCYCETLHVWIMKDLKLFFALYNFIFCFHHEIWCYFYVEMVITFFQGKVWEFVLSKQKYLELPNMGHKYFLKWEDLTTNLQYLKKKKSMSKKEYLELSNMGHKYFSKWKDQTTN